MIIPKEFKFTAGVLTAIAIVTFAHYAWQFLNRNYHDSLPLIYCLVIVLLGLSGYFFIHRHAQRSYNNSHRLTPFSLFLTLTPWGMLWSLPSLYSPYNWAWSWSARTIDSEAGQMISLLLVLSGLAGLLFSFAWLGPGRSTGQNQSRLVNLGPYRFTRNPQLVAGALIPTGYFILRPSWYAAGWIALLVLFAHLMVITEEGHLNKVFGSEYDEYCRNTPRYLFRF